jgi:molecular chaperone DnaJ
MFSISHPCSRCGGRGAVIEDPCPTCHGSGATQTVKRYRVNIPAGVRDGSRIRLPGKGEPGQRGGPPGDLYVITRVTPSAVFKRKGDNVEVEVPLTIVEACRSPRLGGKGRGDLHVRFVIDMPTKLTKEQRAAVDQLSEVMNGDPRAALFEATRRSTGPASEADA